MTMNLKIVFLICSILLPSYLIAAELGQLTPQQVLEKSQNQQALIVDIRTAAEWQATGTIAHSHKLQSFDQNGKFDAEKWLADLEKLKTSPDQTVILVCRSGNRSSKVGNLLSQQGEQNIYHLTNGIQGWIQSGQPLSPE